MRAIRVRLTYVLIVAAWFAAARLSPAFAQIAAGEITGIITDQSGMPVPGATVTVTQVDTNIPRIVTSSEQGVYTAPSLAPGMYRVQVERSGFRPVRREGIRTPAQLPIGQLLISADVCDRIRSRKRPMIDLFDEIHSKTLINKWRRRKVATTIHHD